MAKKHKNLDNILIQWDGDLSKPSDGSAQSSPDNVDLGTWGGYIPCWYPNNYADCVIADMYFEDFDIIQNNDIQVFDAAEFWSRGRVDIKDEILQIILGYKPIPPKAPIKTYTWGDVSFLIEIADGIGTGSRRAREARLQKLDKEKKKRLIRLICRVKGEEEVYDETKEVYPGDIQLKLDDVDMVINKVIGTMKVSTEWEEVPWDYKYDK